MLYRVIDYFPHTFGAGQINTVTAIVLPLNAAFCVPQSSSLVVLLRVQEMMVVDVFQYEARFNLCSLERH